jgi:hypothetical protein
MKDPVLVPIGELVKANNERLAARREVAELRAEIRRLSRAAASRGPMLRTCLAQALQDSDRRIRFRRKKGTWT